MPSKYESSTTRRWSGGVFGHRLLPADPARKRVRDRRVTVEDHLEGSYVAAGGEQHQVFVREVT